MKCQVSATWDHRRHFRARAADEALGEARHFLGHDAPLDDLNAAPAREVDHRLARDAVEEAVGDRRVDRAVLHEQHIRAGAFGDTALPVEHQRVGIAAPLRAVLGERADHVETRSLGEGGRGLRIGPAIFRQIELDALHLGGDIEHRGPVPHRDRDIDRRVLGGDRHHLAAAPGDRAHVAILEAVLVDDELLGLVEFGNRVGDFEIENLRGIAEALRMFGRLENAAAIGALTLEHAGAVMQAVAQYMELGVLPRHERAVHPDESITLVERKDRHSKPPRLRSLDRKLFCGFLTCNGSP